MPLVTETVTGTDTVRVPSESVMLVAPLRFDPMPIDVTTKTADGDIGVIAMDDGETVATVGSLLTAVIVPVKGVSVTVSCCVPFTPPNAMLVGFTLPVGVIVGVGVGTGVGVGLGVADGVALGPALAVGLAVGAEVAAPVAAADAATAGMLCAPPLPPQPAIAARAQIE